MKNISTRTGIAGVALLVAALTLTGCGAAAEPEPAPSEAASTPEPTVAEAVAVDLAAIEAVARDADWSFAQQGLGPVETVAIADGAGIDDLGRSYEVGPGIEGDADGDGTADAVIPITQLDGNAIVELWYIWRGDDEADVAAAQVPFPIARTTRCGDAVNGVTAVEGGFQIDQVLRMPVVDDALACSEPGTGVQVREVAIEQIDGAFYPIQTAPTEAWGGVCPRSPHLDGFVETGLELRAAPPQSAPIVTDPAVETGLFDLGDGVGDVVEGVTFVGFLEDFTGTDVVRQHCAFAN